MLFHYIPLGLVNIIITLLSLITQPLINPGIQSVLRLQSVVSLCYNIGEKGEQRMASVIVIRDIPGVATVGETYEVFGVEPHIFGEDSKFLIFTPEGWKWAFAFNFKPCT